MRLTVAGCGDAFCSGGRSNTCYVVESGDSVLALDFGATAPLALARLGIDSARLDMVMLSHLHGDHFGGLPILLIDGQFERARSRPLTIVGPPGTRTRLDALMEAMFPGMGAMAWRFDWRVKEVAPGSTTAFGPLTLTTAEVRHAAGAPATALRLSDGQGTLAFSGDTAWTDALGPIADGADLFICECSAFDDAPAGHMSYRALATHRAALAARRILLTHMGADMLARRDEVDGALFLLAADGLVLDV
ncbi:MBL fold metallo-hydrolase [Xanthobacter agilis]|uniref:Ribonuclease BN (tRNA processing enzyme) n=1 Tax=Xanthobacter agilis TaxID=47492 RepID=A0ABU0L9P8_XANAG|nr:MBL fold metallo-hydrolase [Xanthobacter agilis]MDQ0503863.1 ribonuclease BN (tRNA processing enzyme) [Xanthobacter agilis]